MVHIERISLIVCICFCRSIWDKMNRRTFDRSGYYLIVLCNQFTEQLRDIGDIFRDCWADHMANVNVFVPDAKNDGTIVYTFFPYTAAYCDKAIPVVLNRFIGNSFVYDAVYFPNKFKNMFKCTLYGTMTHLRPFAIYETGANGQMKLSGFEIDFIRGIADHLNFSLVNYPNLQQYNVEDGNNIGICMVGHSPNIPIILQIGYLCLSLGRKWNN